MEFVGIFAGFAILMIMLSLQFVAFIKIIKALHIIIDKLNTLRYDMKKDDNSKKNHPIPGRRI